MFVRYKAAPCVVLLPLGAAVRPELIFFRFCFFSCVISVSLLALQLGGLLFLILLSFLLLFTTLLVSFDRPFFFLRLHFLFYPFYKSFGSYFFSFYLLTYSFLLFLRRCFLYFIIHFILLYFLYLHKFTNNSLGKECTSHVRYFSFYFIFVFHFIHFSFHMFSFIFPSVICFHSFNMFFLLFPFPFLLSNFSLYFMLIFLD